jgi:uncharacterized protein (DUF2062 family)
MVAKTCPPDHALRMDSDTCSGNRRAGSRSAPKAASRQCRTAAAPFARPCGAAPAVGLVQEVVPAGQQIARAMELAAIIGRNAPLGIQVTKQATLKYVEHGEAAAIAYIPTIPTGC